MPIRREWIEIVDPKEPEWIYNIDLTLMVSTFGCIYGCGCKGIEPGQDEAIGCCTLGAYFTDKKDLEQTKRSVERLLRRPDLLQHHKQASERWISKVGGDFKTRVVNGACVFSNRSDFDGPHGCALHILAMEEGRHHMSTKPEVCWQVPLHLDFDDETKVITLRKMEQDDWSADEDDFEARPLTWWCAENPEIYEPFEPEVRKGELSNKRKDPLYIAMRDEIIAMTSQYVYDELSAVIRERLYVNAEQHAAGVVFGDPQETYLTITQKVRDKAERRRVVVTKITDPAPKGEAVQTNDDYL